MQMVLDCKLFIGLCLKASKEAQRSGTLWSLLASGHQWRHRYNSLCDWFATGAGAGSLSMPRSSSQDPLNSVYTVSSFTGDLAWVAHNLGNSRIQKHVRGMAMSRRWFLMHRAHCSNRRFRNRGQHPTGRIQHFKRRTASRILRSKLLDTKFSTHDIRERLDSLLNRRKSEAKACTTLFGYVTCHTCRLLIIN